MAFFAPTFTSTDSLSPFFRLLNDFDGPAFDTSSSPLAAYLTPLPCRRSSTPVRRSLASFQPKFDVRETADAYELHGELAGLDKQDVHIEFTDPQTLVVRGRVERCYTSKPREQMPTEAASEESARDAAEEHAAEAHAEAAHGADHEEAQPATAEAPASPKFHKATVEDTPDKDDAFSVTSMSTTHTAPPAEPEEKAAPVPATAATAATATAAATATVQEKPKTEADAAKYWVQERSVGEFSRTFSFPRLVRQDEVHAALENGILTVVVPKARMETRRVVVF